MGDDLKKSDESEIRPEADEKPAPEAERDQPVKKDGDSGGGWGGWGFSPLSYLSDLQKAATVAAEEISRNAVEAAKIAAKHIAETIDEDVEASAEEHEDESAVKEEIKDEDIERRNASLDKLEKASRETLLSHGLKVIDTSVESFTSGAWQALGTAWKGIENSASNLAESIQHSGTPRSNGPNAPSLLETGKAFTAKGLQVLEQVGKETMDLLVSEAGIYMGKKTGGQPGEDQLFEDVTFDRCFYIYGGPEQLEELEALSNHYVLLYNRRKAKLSSEQKSIYEGKLKEVQNAFDLGAEFDGSVAELEKGKKVDVDNDDTLIEWKKVHDSSVRKAAELAAGFASALAGLAPNDIIQRTSGRLDALHSEGIHRLSEMCCLGVTQLLMLGRSLISHKTTNEKAEEGVSKMDWPEDSVERAKIMRTKTLSMTLNLESVFNSFITGISDVAESYLAAIENSSGSEVVVEKAKIFSQHLRDDHGVALGKMQDGLQCLSYVVMASSMPLPSN